MATFENLEQAIAHSINFDEIVSYTSEGDAMDEIEDLPGAEDYTDLREQYGYVDVWGVTDEGEDWRLYIYDAEKGAA